MNPEGDPARRLDRAVDHVSVIFRGATARSDEIQCVCHWGSEEELALLKIPDVPLDPDLLFRTWSAPDWRDHGAVLRRILPQLAGALADGRLDHVFGMHEVGRSFARGRWQEWPAPLSGAVWEFLHAWWGQNLTRPDPAVSVPEVFALCAEASASAGPWLTAWEALDHPVADRHLADLVTEWADDLLADRLPWGAWGDEDDLRAELATWLARYAPARLRARGASEELLHVVRLIGLPEADRWEDPHWPH
ncbi:hypothetical protein ACWCPT_30475 [Streptomyces sp. NPDC002308]